MTRKLAEELYSAQIEVAQALRKRDHISTARAALQAKLAKVANEIRQKGRLPPSEYRALCVRQEHLCSKLADLQAQLEPIKDEIRKWSAIENGIRAELLVSGNQIALPSASSDAIVRRLSALRSYYLEFAEDQTRVNSMRLMAATFANELTDILDTRPITESTLNVRPIGAAFS